MMATREHAPRGATRSEQALSLVILAGAMLYIATRFSEKGGFINVGFYLPLAAFFALGVLTRGRVLRDLFRCRLGWALTAYALVLGYSVLIAPSPAASWGDFVPAHGRALLTALFVAHAAADPRNARYLLMALVGGGLVVVVRQAGLHVQSWQSGDSWFPTYGQAGFYWLRPLGEAYAVYLPALIAIIFISPSMRKKAALTVLAAVEAALLMATGLRGVWLGVGVAAAVAAGITRRWKQLAAFAAIAGAGIAVVFLAYPDSIVGERLARGFDTSQRVSGTWEPGMTLIREHPWRGYGYGLPVFHDAYNAAAPANPQWSIRNSIGPHNIYLGAWFSGGIGMLVVTLWVFTEMILALARSASGSSDVATRALALATLSALTAAYLVHGFFEDKQWLAFGILAGLALGLAASREAAASAGARRAVDAAAVGRG